MKPVTAGLIISLVLGTTPYLASAAPQDFDNDGVPNSLDPDFDGDGIPNVYEQYNDGIRWRFAADGAWDNDGDGWSNAEEYRRVTNLNDPNSNPDMLTGPALQKVFGFDAGVRSWFGKSVDVEGDWAVIGATAAKVYRDLNGNLIEPYAAGAVYVYHRENGDWVLHDKLVPEMTDEVTGEPVLPTEFSGFGNQVALTLMDDHDYPTIAVSATNIDSVFIFKAPAGNWQQTGMIEGPEGEDFAESMALDGDTVAIGAPLAYADDAVGLDLPVGKVYLYDVHSPSDMENPVAITAISYCENGVYCEFGKQIALDGDTLVASSQSIIGEDYVYVYRYSDGAWTQEAELSSALSGGDEFGVSVAISGDRILIADYEFDFFYEVGDIFEFTRTDGVWTEEGAIYAVDFGANLLGNALVLDGDTALVSDDGGSIIGLQKIAGVWSEIGRNDIAPEDENTKHYLGLDVTGGTALVGAPEDFDGGEKAGAAYFVDLNSIQ